MDSNYDPIQKEKSFLEKIWESVKGKKRKKIEITFCDPKTNKERGYTVGYYNSDELQKMKENSASLADAFIQAGVSIDVARKAIIKFNKVI